MHSLENGDLEMESGNFVYIFDLYFSDRSRITREAIDFKTKFRLEFDEYGNLYSQYGKFSNWKTPNPNVMKRGHEFRVRLNCTKPSWLW